MQEIRSRVPSTLYQRQVHEMIIQAIGERFITWLSPVSRAALQTASLAVLIGKTPPGTSRAAKTFAFG